MRTEDFYHFSHVQGTLVANEKTLELSGNMPGFFNDTVLDLSELQVELASSKAKLEKSQELMPALEEQISKPFSRADELTELSQDVTVLDFLMSVSISALNTAPDGSRRH